MKETKPKILAQFLIRNVFKRWVMEEKGGERGRGRGGRGGEVSPSLTSGQHWAGLHLGDQTPDAKAGVPPASHFLSLAHHLCRYSEMNNTLKWAVCSG